MDLHSIGPLAWLIPAFTALAFVTIIGMIATGRASKNAAWVAVAGIGASTLLAVPLFFAALGSAAGSGHGDAATGGLAVAPFVKDWAWLPMGRDAALKLGIMIDPLSAAAVAMVTVVCTAIFVFASSYMEGEFGNYRDARTGQADPQTGRNRYARFFAYVSLFATGMLGFVLSSNLLQALLFWEVMGLCSFLLIGFWNFKPSAAAAAKKAFLTTRVGDCFFFLGILGLYWVFGSVDYADMLSKAGIDKIHALAPFAVEVAGRAFAVPVIPLLALLVFGGSVGKSAMFPLHVWLPDAMEGPTPVSALIHAATMVSAGVFLIARMYPVFSAATPEQPGDISGPMFIVAALGAFTAILAATIAVAQFDIKRVLAYSTVSQLGFMVAALGIGAYVAAVFHLLTHAFFKALLFLGSGSVIHGMEHGMHHGHGGHADGHGHGHDSHGTPFQPRRVGGVLAADPLDPQDMRNMGGLAAKMPWTFRTYLVGTAALTGIPLLAGFWSKDEILAEAFHKGVQSQIAIALVVYVLLTAAAFFTAFYMWRQVFLVYGGKPSTDMAAHAHESSPAMTGPLVFLSVFAALLGFVGVPEGLPVLGPALGNPFHHFVGALTATGSHFEALAFDWMPMLISTAVALLGLGAAWLLYGRDPAAARARDPLARLGRLWSLLNNKYNLDEIYGLVVTSNPRIHGEADVTEHDRTVAERLGKLIGLTDAFSRLNAQIDARLVDGAVNLAARTGEAFSRLNGLVDRYVVDGAVNLVAFAGQDLSRGLKLLQTGRVQQYALIVLFALLFLVGALVM
jgi:NADH-quinone oxidoreductase subunit L